MTAVAGFHNPRVRAARLLGQKKHRRERRCFLVEGPLAIEAALDAGAGIAEVFVCPGDEHADAVAARARAAGVEVLEVDERTLRSLADTREPQRIVAVAPFVHREITALADALPARPSPCLLLVLHEIADPGNAGTLIRSADAFGADGVAFGPAAVDVYNPKVVRSSMGSIFGVPLFAYDRWEALAEASRAAGVDVGAAAPGAPDVTTVTVPPRCALVVGNERHGLAGIPADGLAWRVGIPQRGRAESLNAAVAGS
ncbi:MAG TPA: RNA methyltransferase, partial [Candidatus Eremiobacteraceae bacterium]|nr:RNA methyltransferase [Candidatus Eremiobacteraceae bacterium]